MFQITCGPDGLLYDWQAGVRITPDGTEAIDPLLLAIGDCPVCQRASTELRLGMCLACFHGEFETDDHGD
jgi:hypothetical protein